MAENLENIGRVPAADFKLEAHAAEGSGWLPNIRSNHNKGDPAAPVVGPRGHVIAIEPNPETVTKLEANIRVSGAKVIVVAPVARSDADAMLDLFAAPAANTGERSLSKVKASQTGTAVATYKVRARPLDDIVREAGVSRVDVIKIDVEGAEYLVLEIIDHQLQQTGSSTAQVREFFREQGDTARHSVGDNVEFGFGLA